MLLHSRRRRELKIHYVKLFYLIVTFETCRLSNLILTFKNAYAVNRLVCLPQSHFIVSCLARMI